MELFWFKKYNLLIFDEIDSTNSEAIRLAKSAVTGNFLIWAKSQKAGRGRYGREWHSPIGNLYMSLLLDEDIDIINQAQLSFVTSIAVYETIEFLAQNHNRQLDIQLKWPNDVLINGKKIAGILLESIRVGGKSYLIIGLGINIANSPKNIEKPATSLLAQGLDTQSVDEVLNIFVNSFDKHFVDWNQSGFTKTRLSWLEKAANLGKIITIDDGRNKISGKFNDIDSVGNIRIILDTGEVKSLSTGEVFFGKINER